MISVQKYSNFKQALEYFVTHLEFVQNNDKNISGFSKYLKPYVDTNSFKMQGSGYSEKRHYKIQDQMNAFSEYEFAKLCITVIPSKWNGSYTDKGCYLHWLGTSFNIVAIWKKINHVDHIIGLQILVAKWMNSKWCRQSIIDKSLVNLGLFDKKSPNKDLIDFYNTFESLLFRNYNSNSKIENKFEIKSHKAPSERIFRSSPCEKVINIEHTKLQDQIVKILKDKYKDDAVFQEVSIQNSRLDVLVKIQDNGNIVYDIYEIKPYGSFYSCVREAIGQLIEYKYKCLDKLLNIRKLYIAGIAKRDDNYLKFIKENYDECFDYIQIPK